MPDSPRVSVVLLAYYPERFENLRRIVALHQASACVPDEILIWDNSGTCPEIPGAHLLRSPRNLGCQARFLAGVAASSELVVFQDDDIALERFTLSNLLLWEGRLRREGTTPIVGLDSRIRTPGESRYKRWNRVSGRHFNAPKRATVTQHTYAMSKGVLSRLLRHFPWNLASARTFDCLWLSWCAEVEGVPFYVVPYGSMEGETLLDTCGVGISHDKTVHYAAADAAVAEIWGTAGG